MSAAAVAHSGINIACNLDLYFVASPLAPPYVIFLYHQLGFGKDDRLRTAVVAKSRPQQVLLAIISEAIVKSELVVRTAAVNGGVFTSALFSHAPPE